MMASMNSFYSHAVAGCIAVVCLTSGCAAGKGDEQAPEAPKEKAVGTNAVETATFAGGCFWCTEAVYERIPGVLDVKSGYTGGKTVRPTYKEVCSGETGHAEAVQITFDPSRVSFEKLLDVFWKAHDPTTLNRQGGDVGTQYRSVVFYHGERQKEIALASRDKLARSGHYKSPVVTEIVPASVFYPAEDYHQDFYDNNRAYPYCRAIIAPKLKKLDLPDPQSTPSSTRLP